MELGPLKRNDCLRNHATESWHNAFNSMVSVAHPTAGRLALKLQQQQHSSALKRNQLQTGQAHPKKRKNLSKSRCCHQNHCCTVQLRGPTDLHVHVSEKHGQGCEH